MIPLVKVFMPPSEELMPALQEVLYSGVVAEGKAVYSFEEEFGSCFELPAVLAMSSGTAALHAALTLAGVGSGDEVISTPMTAEPTNTSILYCGAKVVWADVDPGSGNICPDSVRSLITPRTKAILCVHYAGYPVSLASLREIADEFNVALIEDCAHALGARYDGKYVGTIGDFSIFSFQAIKHMTTVDGGILAMRDPRHLNAARKFRWFGMLKGVPRTDVNIESLGYKYNMNNVTATIGRIQLRHMPEVLATHIKNGQFLDRFVAGISGIASARIDAAAGASYWLYTLLSDSSADIERALLANGISASKVHKPNNLHGIFSESQRDLPGLDTFYRRLVHIPCGWWVTEADCERILSVLQKG